MNVKDVKIYVGLTLNQGLNFFMGLSKKYVLNDEDKMLLDFIAGRGKWSLFGPGIHTYPKSKEKIQIYNKCLHLEKLGLVKRVIDKPDYVVWEII